jgi:hypothetical protein
MNQVLTNADDLRDIHPPIVIPSLWIWVWIAVAFCVTLAALAFVWYFWRNRRQAPPPLPVVPAHIRARQKLDEALAHIAQAKIFCTMVSDTIRMYLEERFDFHAPERTTEEFLYELRGTNLLLPDQKESLGEFLKRCDLVKFARYEPGQPELRDLRESALRLVDETEPQPEPAATAEPPTGKPPVLRNSDRIGTKDGQSAIANQP